MCTALLLVSTATSASAQRIVFVRNDGEVGSQSVNAILSETLDRISVELGSRQRTFDTIEVVDVVYGRGSASFERAEQALETGDLDNAIALFDAASSDSEPPWVAPHALLRKAETEAKLGSSSYDDALATLEQFLREYDDHRRLPDALLLRARLAGASGDTSTLDEAVDEIVALADAGRITADWRPRALVERGNALLDAGNASRAGEAFDNALVAAQNAKRDLGLRRDLAPAVDQLALEARVGQGSVMLAEGDVMGARSHFRRLEQDAGDDRATRVAALVGLAECDFREGGKLKEAQFAFARASVQAAGSPDEHARSLYYLGLCAQQLGDAGEEPNGRQRAAAYFEDIQDWYPNSRWARLAREAQP